MKKIIVPVDFSSQNEKLIDYAIDFAKLVNGQITLIYVASMDLGYAIGDLGYQYIPEVESTALKDDAKKLDEYKTTIENKGIKCDRQLLQGIPSVVILDMVEKELADFLVIGSHGRSGFYDVFVGSLTKELTQKATIPVLVVPVHQ